MRGLVEAHTRRALESQSPGSYRPFDQFRKQGCVEARTGQASGYDCYYAATLAAQPGRPALTVNGKGRFTRTDKGLIFEDLGAQPR